MDEDTNAQQTPPVVESDSEISRPEPTPQSNKRTISPQNGILLALAATGLIVIVILIANSLLSPNSIGINGTTNPQQSTDQSGKVFTVTSPAEFEFVSPNTEFSGTASSSLESISIKIYDLEDNLLAEKEIDLRQFPSSNGTIEWSTTIPFDLVPASGSGFAVIFPTAEGMDSELSRTVNVQFATAE